MGSNLIYTSIESLLESCDSIKARIAMTEQILENLENAMLKGANKGHFESYKLDTGHTRTEIMFRSMNEIVMAYNALILRLDRLYTKLEGRRNGRVFRLVDGRNFRNFGNF